MFLPYTQRTPETEVVVGWRGLGVGEGHGLLQQEGDGWERAGKEDTVPSTRDSSEQFKTFFLLLNTFILQCNDLTT